MFCSNCGKEIPDDAEFCSFCGASMQNEQDESEPEVIEETKKSIPALVHVACVLFLLIAVVLGMVWNAVGVVRSALSEENVTAFVMDTDFSKVNVEDFVGDDLQLDEFLARYVSSYWKALSVGQSANERNMRKVLKDKKVKKALAGYVTRYTQCLLGKESDAAISPKDITKFLSSNEELFREELNCNIKDSDLEYIKVMMTIDEENPVVIIDGIADIVYDNWRRMEALDYESVDVVMEVLHHMEDTARENHRDYYTVDELPQQVRDAYIMVYQDWGYSYDEDTLNDQINNLVNALSTIKLYGVDIEKESDYSNLKKEYPILRTIQNLIALRNVVIALILQIALIVIAVFLLKDLVWILRYIGGALFLNGGLLLILGAQSSGMVRKLNAALAIGKEFYQAILTPISKDILIRGGIMMGIGAITIIASVAYGILHKKIK